MAHEGLEIGLLLVVILQSSDLMHNFTPQVSQALQSCLQQQQQEVEEDEEKEWNS